MKHASEIDKCHNDNAKTYQAVKFINRKPLQNLMIHDKAGRNVTKLNAVCKIIRDHFKEHFNNLKESNLEPFIGSPRPLEVAKSIHKLRNNRASGYGQITPELLIYVSPELHDLTAESHKSLQSTSISVLVMNC